MVIKRTYYTLIVACLVINYANCLSVNKPITEFSEQYFIEGVILLPYAEIQEPFVGYYDSVNKRSRIDYYGDLAVTVQRGDLNSKDINGVSYKLVYTADQDGNPVRSCFQLNGSFFDPVLPQPLLPDLTGYKLLGSESCPMYFYTSVNESEAKCEKWGLMNHIDGKRNKYTMWLQRDENGNPLPVYYEMEGYNSLFHFHYDKHGVAYRNMRVGSINQKVFEVTQNISCTGFPGPGAGSRVHFQNPIGEFINHESYRKKHNEKEFDRFKKRHSKSYQGEGEEAKRKSNFIHNHRFVQSNNRKNFLFKLKLNHLSDRSNEELKMLRGRVISKGYNGGNPFDDNESDFVPDQLDWRLMGAVNPVKDQGFCGSCWSFGTTGTIEGVNFVKTKQLLSLSEQQLIDCSWNYGDNGCDGGEDFRAYEYIIKAGGLADEEEYGHYLSQDGKCKAKDVEKVVKLKGFVNVTSKSPKALKVALFKNGPVTVAIDASHKSFTFYSNGIYFEPTCGNEVDNLDHQVLVVGYGKLYGQPYWLVKNSWSTYWGNDGYILMSQKDNNCGVMTIPTYPIIA